MSKSQKKGGNGLFMLATLAIAAVAIKRELDRPKEERTWTGTVVVPVPYDFRMPTKERLMAAWWNPDDERIFTPRPLGIGWAVNVGGLVKRVTDR